MSRVSAAARRARLDAIAGRRPVAGSGVSSAHRRAVLAGAPSSTADPRKLPRKLRTKGAAVTYEYVAAAAKRAGTSRYAMLHPGASGHERCRNICIVYG